MKLLLTSGGLMNQSLINALQELVEKPFSELKLAFISTASQVEEGGKDWVIKDLTICTELGFASIDIVDISSIPRVLWEKRLNEADVLLFEGGNTFHLMHWIEKSGLKEVLPEMLRTKIYIGISAGTIVTTPTLKLSSSERGLLDEIGEEVFEDGLGLVPFLTEVHINSKWFPELTFPYIEEESKKQTETIYALDDQSAIKVVDDKVEVISEGQWKKFN